MPMEENLRSGDRSEIVVKKRSSSGCLIVRKKGDVVGGGCVGSSGSRKGFAVKIERKRPRPRTVVSDSESSEEGLPLPVPPRRGVAAETIRVCNGLTIPGKHVPEDTELASWNGEDKGNKLNVFDFDEYDRMDGEMMLMSRRRLDGGGMGKRFMGSQTFARSGRGMEFESGSSRHSIVASRKSSYFDRKDVERMPLSATREKYVDSSDKPIRVQGKNGVLKVHVNKKKKLGGSLSDYDQWKRDDNRKGSGYEGIVKKKAVVLPAQPDLHESAKKSRFMTMEKNRVNRQKFVPTETNDSSEEDSGDNSDMLLRQRSEDSFRMNALVYSSKAGKKRLSNSGIDMEKKTSKYSKFGDGDSDDMGATLKRKSVEVEARGSSMKVSPESEKTPKAKAPAAQGMVVKRGSGTEKQKLRENIRNMLLSAGWKIDYKPRRNRDYLDAVYVSPSGTSYWSIIKAYDALQKQLDNGAGVSRGDRSAFVVSDDILSQLTRKTQKKMEKELKKKRRDGTESENARKRTSNVKEEADSTDSEYAEENPSSFMKQGVKSLIGSHKKSEKVPSSILSLQGRKSRKSGRCTLLVRSSGKGSNSEIDGFVPYTGKRTILSWLIDSGVVELSQKVQYMNRKKTRVLQEGWITRDGIHCGCCSKILTVSKFEIHAGSKLRQPFQNIYLDSGVSLLQCQIDAWNRQEESDRLGFHKVDINGDDPNDDTCGRCGDGGDLICCDGCPSTFHQSCLNIQMLPQGDWHCPNCTCCYCGSAGEASVAVSELVTCNLCERKFHKSCTEDTDVLAVDSAALNSSFCSQKCKELLEHLEKYLGVKHEIEAGFSWSLIQRTDPESDSSLRGLPQRVECNSKLAVALSIMDECFLPIVDRRTGINMIHNVLYNCGSNFSRINYGGFYTVILERGDEIISAASLRFHGAQLAEMPFIGTRHIYRRQGMCRRLFSVIESALRSLRVEKLVIPAISELMDTWTVVFGFTPAEESLKREMRSLNMLVFPGLDMLQKLLLEQQNTEKKGTAASFSGAAAMDTASEKSDGDDSSSKQDEWMGDRVEEDMECDPDSQGGSLNNADDMNSSSDEEQTGNAPCDANGSSDEIEENRDSEPHAEVSVAKPIENGEAMDSFGAKSEASHDQSTPPHEGTENSEEIVEMNNDAQSPTSQRDAAGEMEAKQSQAMEEEATEETGLNSGDASGSPVRNEVDPTLNNPGTENEPADMEAGDKPVLSHESEGDVSSSTDSDINDANKVD